MAAARSYNIIQEDGDGNHVVSAAVFVIFGCS